jgi:integrase
MITTWCFLAGVAAFCTRPTFDSFCRPNEKAGLPRVRFHNLRHTAATLMLSLGVHPKVASEMLGHSTIAVTLDLYSHVTETMVTPVPRRRPRQLG